MKKISLVFIGIILTICNISVIVCQTEDDVRNFLNGYNTDAVGLCNAVVDANWQVAINQDDTTGIYLENQIARSSAYAEFRQEQIQSFDGLFGGVDIQDVDLIRHVKYFKDLGTAALSPALYEELTRTVGDMARIYNSATICRFGVEAPCAPQDQLTLDPHMEQIMAESNDYDELLYTWTEWREQSGRNMKDQYNTYIDIINQAGVENGHANAAEWWQDRYEDENFVQMVDELWDVLAPFYDELHTFVRYKLLEIYDGKMDRSDPNIPAHLLGNMWAQSWTNLYDRIKPYPDASLIDITGAMIAQNYTILKMFEVSDDFYKSMGLIPNDMSYDESAGAIIQKPEGRTIACHASAWDFCNGTDYRIKMCTNINMVDFKTVHHEMGHIQYFLQYRELPLVLRGGANPGFHEAVGDAIALSVQTPKHLKEIGLLGDDYLDSPEDNINALFQMALSTVAFLPFGLLIDKWRWDIFSNPDLRNNMNEHWWTLRERYQKVTSPVERTSDHFDPGSKYHVPNNSQYIAYFIAHLIQFQMYKALCIEAGEYDPTNPTTTEPLHKCDFYNSELAGMKLAAGLELGMSRNWTDTLEVITGESTVNANAILEYFAPLREYFKSANLELSVKFMLEDYDVLRQNQCNAINIAEWAVATDINNEELQEELKIAVRGYASFAKEQYNEYFRNYTDLDFEDESIRRQMNIVTNLGTSILDDTDLDTLTTLTTAMQSVYNNAKVCPFEQQSCDLEVDGMELEPEITERMADSNNYDELEYIWHTWHESTGNLMRSNYAEYVELVNKAAMETGFNDYGEVLRTSYEDENLIENMKAIWETVKPLYNELHKYVRNKLIGVYGDKIDSTDDLIPAHLLGNMWAQSWVNLYERIKPFPDASDVDVTAAMVAKGYTVMDMFEESNRFYMNLGLEDNTVSYTGLAIIEKPDNRTIVCHASAWDFCDGQDFRIKQCTEINMVDFVTVHHEMGHIQYYLLYKDQPQVFRGGANPGFHEAVGDLIALSVSTPTHLVKIGLLENYADSEADNINALFKMALERVAFLPFGLLIDLYRYEIFSNQVTDANLNQRWEELREEYQRIRSPVERNETNFDAGAKFHVASGYEYVNYFIAHILEFQLHKALCIEAGQYDPTNSEANPLHKCDIEGSTEAGVKLRDGLKLGLSQHWNKTLEIMTGENTLNSAALLEYFKPLMEFLERENAIVDEAGVNIGAIVGGVIGGLLAIALIGYLIYYYKKKRA